MNIDLKQLEKSALDTHAVCGLLACLSLAVRQTEQDSSTARMSEVLCWQIREALDLASDILQNTSQVFLESVDVLERETEDLKEKGFEVISGRFEEGD